MESGHDDLMFKALEGRYTFSLNTARLEFPQIQLDSTLSLNTARLA